MVITQDMPKIQDVKHSNPPFGKVLVANRGEIAVRVMKAVKEMGMKAVAIYSDADKYAMHVRYADEAFHVGPAPALESYLNIQKVIDVAEKAHVDAVHPGYGFLSERADFAEAVTKAGITWVGPPPDVMNAIRSKMDGKVIAKRAGTPISPGSEGAVESVDEAKKIAERIGYPVMIKASYGGGGIGITRVDNPEQLAEAYERSRRLALTNFGKHEVYIEKMAVNPRHIETQLICVHGECVVGFERECTIQRRNMKMIEEAPSPVLTDEQREKFIDASIAFGKEIKYHVLGTMEFVYSDLTKDFYFLELNKRLQVEHPITEYILGIDLVKLQFRIASGEPLPFTQEELWKRRRGHAIEFRVYAEDPLNNFTGSSGTVTYYREPTGPHVRVDSGYETGDYMPPFYDSLILKLIVWGQDRNYAVQTARRALNDLKIGGIKSVVPYYKVVLNDEDYLSGKFTTGYVAEKYESMLKVMRYQEEVKAAIAASMYNRGLLKTSTPQRTEVKGNNAWKTHGLMSQSNLRVMW